jgi:hypothetical protein
MPQEPVCHSGVRASTKELLRKWVVAAGIHMVTKNNSRGSANLQHRIERSG